MYTKVEIITPDIAKTYLEKNTANYRKLTRSKVRDYAHDMQLGLWQLNGEPIKFNKSGTLTDGQHRLNAVIESNLSIPFLVVYDVDDNVNIYDSGKNRSTGEVLTAENALPGVRDNTCVGAIRMLLAGNFKGRHISTAQVLKYVRHRAELWNEVSYIITKGSRGKYLAKVSAIALATFCLLNEDADLEELRCFFRIVNSGYPLNYKECSSAIALRNQILDCKQMKSDYDTREILFFATIDAFRDFHHGKSRMRKYSVNEKNILMLVELCKKERECL